LVVTAIGWALMLAGYMLRARIDPSAPWSTGAIIIGPVQRAEKSGETPADDKTTDPKATAAANATKEGEFPGAIPAHLRLLSSNEAAEMILMMTGDEAPDKGLGVKGQVRVKLIEVALDKAGIDSSALASGKLPEPGQDEIIAGARIKQHDQLIVGGRPLKIVGVLKPDFVLFADSCLIPPSESSSNLFPADATTVWPAQLVRLPAGGVGDEKNRKQLAEAFPPEKYAAFAPEERLEPQSFYIYLGGLALLLLGGTGVLIGVYRWLARRLSSDDHVPFFAAPLVEMNRRPRLLWAVHLIYFGIVIAGAVLIHEQPEVQAVLLGKVVRAFDAKGTPLSIVPEAYRAGNIPLAAAVTFVVNFFAGSLGVITLPSIVFFGAGLFLAWFRALVWGLLFAPTTSALAYSFLPHSGTMLLEGGGYILAAFFGCLIPIITVSGKLGGNPLTRWGRALLLNLGASFWIALVLAIAAIYEATEVILMNR
jgi:hypothetical protein